MAKKKAVKKAATKTKPALDYDPQIRCKFDKMVLIDAIRPHPDNPNKHTPEQIARFIEILKYTGTRRPFRISKRSNFLIAGHGQLEAYRAIGWKKCPVEYQDYEDEQQEYADIVADNSLATWAQMDLSVISSKIMGFGESFNTDFLGIDGFAFDPATFAFPEQIGQNERTKDERTDQFMASQSRNIILVYSLAEFGRVTELLQEIMKHRRFDSFSDAISAILEEYARDIRKQNGGGRKKTVVQKAAERN